MILLECGSLYYLHKDRALKFHDKGKAQRNDGTPMSGLYMG